MDAADFLKEAAKNLKGNCLFYFDPPYYDKGGLLYTNHYEHSDHVAVAKAIKNIKHPWIVTYDALPVTESLYSDFPSIHFSLTYSAHLERAKASEVMFYNGLHMPDYIKKMTMPYFGRYNLKDIGGAAPTIQQ
jgi:DNA adenine methylase